MEKFFTDIFSEETKEGVGKFSAKRTMGIIVGILAAIGSVLSGLHFYDVPADIMNPMWTFSGTMLGISVLKGLGGK